MANVKITDLTEDTTPADGDWIETVDISAGSSKKVTRLNFLANLSMATTALANPYKFSATSNTVFTSGSGAFSGALAIEDEVYDTNGNYVHTTGVYTAPVAGFYHFDACLGWASASNEIIISLFKNGAEHRRGGRAKGSASSVSTGVSADIQLAANDTVDVRAFGSLNTTDGTTAAQYFNGNLICRT